VLAPVEIDDRGLAVAVADTHGAAPDWARRLESAVKEQSADVRRFIVASLDSFAARIVSDVRDGAPGPAAESVIAPAASVQPRIWPWLAALTLMSGIAIVCGAFWALTREELAKSYTEQRAFAAANAELTRARDELAATNKELSAAVAANAATVTPAAPTNARVEQVPYGEIPFDKGRLDALRDFLTKLEAQNFHGVVKITSSAGLYCLTGNATDGFVPANASVLVGKCDLVGNPFDESLTSQQRQSLAFANLVSGVRQRTAGTITVIIDPAGNPRPAVQYPPRNESITAGEWNRAAAANNRVEFLADAVP
jgi:hypothetical protein